MLKLKKEKVFVRLLKLDVEQLKDQDIFSDVEFLFTKENEELLNKYLSVALLTCTNHLPLNRQVDCLRLLIPKNFLLNAEGTDYLIKSIKKVGVFSLQDMNLLVDSIVQILFARTNFNFYISDTVLPPIPDREAEQKTNQLIEQMEAYFNRQQFEIDFTLYQQRQAKNEEVQCDSDSSIFPSILNGMFPDENKPFQKYPQKIEKQDDYDQIYLPQSYRQNDPNQPIEIDIKAEVEIQDDQNEVIKINPKNEGLPDQPIEIDIKAEVVIQDGQKDAQKKNPNNLGPNDNQMQPLQNQQQQINQNKQPQIELPKQDQVQILPKVQEQKVQPQVYLKYVEQDLQTLPTQDKNYFGKEWRPLVLEDCKNFYLKFEEKKENYESQLKNIDNEFKKVIKTSYDNIYDVSFKAAYFNSLINSQDSEDLKCWCEFYIIKQLIGRAGKENFAGCHTIAYITTMLLFYFKNESFYRMIIGAILYRLPSLLKDQAYEFAYLYLNQNQSELFLIFQMLVLFDNPSYFSSLISFRKNFLTKFLNTYQQKMHIKYDISREIRILDNNIPIQQNQTQRQIFDDYLKLINCSEHKSLGYYLLTIQQICNHKSIMKIEEFLKQNIQSNPDEDAQNKNKEEGSDLTYSDRINQIKYLFDDIYSKKIAQEEQIPTLENISQADLSPLEKKLKIDKTCNFSQKQIFGYLKDLKLYRTGKCPTFTLLYLPSNSFQTQIRVSIISVQEILKKIKQGSKSEQEQYKQEALLLLQKEFGQSLDEKFLSKIQNCNYDRKDYDEIDNLTDTYFPVLFYEFYQQNLK